MEKVASIPACFRVMVKAGGGKDPLTAPLPGGAGVFPLDGVGELDGSGPVFEVQEVLLLDSLDVGEQRFLVLLGKKGDTILASFPVAYQDLVPGEIDVLDPQAEALEESQTGTIEQIIAFVSVGKTPNFGKSPTK